MNAVSACIPSFVEGEKSDLEIRIILIFSDAHDSFPAGFFRTSSLTHQFHHQKCSTGFENSLSHSGSCSCSYLVIHKKSCSDDRAVTYPAMHFVGHSARCTGAGQISMSIQGDHSEGVVVFNMDVGFVFWF